MFLAQVVEPCLAVLQRASRSLGSRLYTFSRTSPLLFRTLLGAHHFDLGYYIHIIQRSTTIDILL